MQQQQQRAYCVDRSSFTYDRVEATACRSFFFALCCNDAGGLYALARSADVRAVGFCVQSLCGVNDVAVANAQPYDCRVQLLSAEQVRELDDSTYELLVRVVIECAGEPALAGGSVLSVDGVAAIEQRRLGSRGTRTRTHLWLRCARLEQLQLRLRDELQLSTLAPHSSGRGVRVLLADLTPPLVV